ncbi:MAG: adenosylcobinamide-GDP ribazoletransferase [Ahrensia sp.]|nr:adenosylcobinamide-GDP ribazoletransferase [Ahrensia sp.]
MSNQDDATSVYARTLDSIVSSILFLSRLPVHQIVRPTEQIDFHRSSAMFPLAGLVIAAPVAAFVWSALWMGVEAHIIVVLAIPAQVLMTGALHEDGLADVADGFWGGHTVDRKLEIMRDSAIGTYGVLALVISICARLVLLSTALATLGPLFGAMLYVACESLSRAAMLWPWSALKPARKALAPDANGKDPSGLSQRYGGPDRNSLLACAVLCLPALLCLILAAGVVGTLVALTFALAATLSLTRLARYHIGGHTGDVLGATQQLALIALYLGVGLTI